MGPFLRHYGKIIVMCIERTTVLQDNNTCITCVHNMRSQFQTQIVDIILLSKIRAYFSMVSNFPIGIDAEVTGDHMA